MSAVSPFEPRLSTDDDSSSSSSSGNDATLLVREPTRPASEKKIKRQVTLLQRVQIALAVLHGLTFVAQLAISIVFRERIFAVPVTYFNGTALAAAATTGESAYAVLGTVGVAWVVLAFPLITAIAHVFYASRARLRYVLVENDGINGWQWVEYALSAGIMTVALALFSGVSDLVALIVLFLANVAMQMLGYVHDDMNRPYYREYYDKASGTTRLAPVRWVAFAAASVLFVAIWFVIGFSFFTAVSTNATAVPWFVYVSFFGLVVQFALFAVVMALHYLPLGRLCRGKGGEGGGCNLSRDGVDLRRAFDYRLAYDFLSLTAKLTLAWVTLIGTVTRTAAA